MPTILLILGAETRPFAKGDYNRGLFETAIATLQEHYTVLTTVVEEGYDVPTEIAKFKQADTVIFQYPVYWFMMPSVLKRYIDDVYVYGEFFGPGHDYGLNGLMEGKTFMLSTTWNAPLAVFDNPDSFFEGQSVAAALFPMRKSQAFCGLTELPHFSCHDVVSNPDFARDQARYQQHLAQVFGLNGEAGAIAVPVSAASSR